MKPAAPVEVRGEFKPIATSVPGIQICEHMPRLARLAHEFTIVRSMTHTMLSHNTATYHVTTGQPPLRDLIEFTPSENDFPHLGAQVAHQQPAARGVPPAVSLPDPVTDGPYTTPGQNGGFLGARYAPFRIDGDPSAPDFTVDGMAASPELGGDRLDSRQELLRTVNQQLGSLTAEHRIEQMGRYQQRAISLLTSET